MVAFGLFFQRPRVGTLLFQVFDLLEAFLVARFFDGENLSRASEFFGAQFGEQNFGGFDGLEHRGVDSSRRGGRRLP